jgi:hypothetical protein
VVHLRHENKDRGSTWDIQAVRGALEKRDEITRALAEGVVGLGKHGAGSAMRG